MSRLRDAAAAFVEQGRALGIVEVSKGIAHHLGALAREAGFAREEAPQPTPEYYSRLIDKLGNIAQGYHDAAVAAEAEAQRARRGAEALMQQIEHPGARLARRLVVTARAARAAWRGSR